MSFTIARLYAAVTSSSALPFPDPSSDDQCAMNIKFIIGEIKRLPDTLEYSKDYHGKSCRPAVVLHLGMIVYYLELLLPHLSGSYAAYPLVAPAIRNIMPAIEFCISGSERFINSASLWGNSVYLCKDLNAALAAVLGKDVKDIEPQLSKRSLAFGRAWRDKDCKAQENKLNRVDGQGASGRIPNFLDCDNPQDSSSGESSPTLYPRSKTRSGNRPKGLCIYILLHLSLGKFLLNETARTVSRKVPV